MFNKTLTNEMDHDNRFRDKCYDIENALFLFLIISIYVV